MPFRSFCHLGIHFSTFRFRVMAVFVRGPLILSFCHFAASEGSPHENGRNSETKSRKMDPKVAKRPKRRGLGPYRKKNQNFLAKIFFGHFWPFFGHFWPVGIEKTIFVKSVFSKSCFYWSKRKKNHSLSPNSKKGVFVKHSNVHVAISCF